MIGLEALEFRLGRLFYGVVLQKIRYEEALVLPRVIGDSGGCTENRAVHGDVACLRVIYPDEPHYGIFEFFVHLFPFALAVLGGIAAVAVGAAVGTVGAISAIGAICAVDALDTLDVVGAIAAGPAVAVVDALDGVGTVAELEDRGVIVAQGAIAVLGAQAALAGVR